MVLWSVGFVVVRSIFGNVLEIKRYGEWLLSVRV